MLLKLLFLRLGKTLDSNIWKMSILLFSLLAISLIVLPVLEGWSISDVLWWFPVTVTTVGYGDIAPKTAIGRILALVVMSGGIGAASVAISSIISKLVEKKARKMNGSSYYTKKDHIVIFGWVQDKTKALIDEIKADTSYTDVDIVLCSNEIEENPLPKEVSFIKGRLSSLDVMERAHVTHAKKIIIYTNNDEHAVLITLSVDAANPQAQIIVYVQESEYAEHIKKIDRLDKDGHISIVEPASIGMIAQEMQDRGVTEIVKTLLSNKTAQTIFRIPVKSKIDYMECTEKIIGWQYNFIGYEDMQGDLKLFSDIEHDDYPNAVFIVSESRPEVEL